MMTQQDFVKSSVDRILNQFPGVKCRYEYHNASYTHFIEVVPHSIYDNEDDYINLEEAIVTEFEQLFPDENICFLSDNSIYKLHNPIYEASGKLSSVAGIKVEYATHESLQGHWETMQELIVNGAFHNVISKHCNVKFIDNGEVCTIYLESPPQVIHQKIIDQNIEALYTRAFIFV